MCIRNEGCRPQIICYSSLHRTMRADVVKLVHSDRRAIVDCSEPTSLSTLDTGFCASVTSLEEKTKTADDPSRLYT